MTLSDIIDQILLFVSSWAGTTLPRVMAAFLGLFICLVTVAAVWDRRTKTPKAFGSILFGMLLIAVSLDTRILHALADTSFLTRIRLIMAILSLGVLAVTIETIRRSHLQERYALLWVWTCAVLLFTALFPQVFELFRIFLGTQYTTSVVAVVFIFLLLIAFHFSIAFSGVQKKQTQIAQRYAILEAKLAEVTRKLDAMHAREGEETTAERETAACQTAVSSDDDVSYIARKYRGAQVAVPLIVTCTTLGILLVGLLAPQAMIGDEVTHYYMLVSQSERLPEPNFFAEIPMEWGDVETRRYPHAFWWHYMGAVLYKLSGGSFVLIQLYQTVFWVQFLVVAYLLSRSRGGIQSRAAILYLLVLASLPMNLIFSVAFYQDVPMAAQILTAFYLLRQRRFWLATVFLVLGVGFKITAVLFIPPFLLLSFLWKRREAGIPSAVLTTCISAVLVILAVWHTDWALRHYADAEYYPLERVRKLPANIGQAFGIRSAFPGGSKNAITLPSKRPRNEAAGKIPPEDKSRRPIIANHPGDLRISKNFVVYGGVLLWLTVIAGCLPIIFRGRRKPESAVRSDSCLWLLGVGGWYLTTAALVLRSAPDARFFLPGLPFLLLPLAESAIRLPKSKILLSLFASLAVLQAGFVLTKTYSLRQLSPPLEESISYLKQNPVHPGKVFMYPEGNYRLFPVPHEWYLGYRLKEFWKSDNNRRIEILRHFHIGAIVVKKHLIGSLTSEMKNLGIYPRSFVSDLRSDPRFQQIFENEAVVIFSVPDSDMPGNG